MMKCLSEYGALRWGSNRVVISALTVNEVLHGAFKSLYLRGLWCVHFGLIEAWKCVV